MNAITAGDLDIGRWLPSGVGTNDVIAGLAALAVLTAILAMWQTLRPKDRVERRLEQIAERRETMRREALSMRARRQSLRPVSLMRAAVARLDLLRSQHAAEARIELARAGIRSPDAMVAYLFGRLALPPLLALIAVAYASLLPLPGALRFAPAAAAAGLGFYAPKIYLANVASRRSHKLRLAVPDSLDLMVICAEAGLSLDATLVRVSRELAATYPEFAEELAITAA